MNHQSAYIRTRDETQVKFELVLDSEICPHIVAEGENARRLRGIIMIQSELEQALEFISIIHDDLAPHMSLALWHAAIMSYARCF